MLTNLGNIFNDNKLELVSIAEFLEIVDHKLSFILGAHRSADEVSTFKEGTYDPRGDVAICTRDENFASFRN